MRFDLMLWYGHSHTAEWMAMRMHHKQHQQHRRLLWIAYAVKSISCNFSSSLQPETIFMLQTFPLFHSVLVGFFLSSHFVSNAHVLPMCITCCIFYDIFILLTGILSANVCLMLLSSLSSTSLSLVIFFFAFLPFRAIETASQTINR